ncbi:unnamed protein product [Brassicogethes aeneus]|uniref:Uncharacterized protein n=1 Tax=Brassicogethes aeneus TaxID=1431903 RepID=A0A9P0B345_BRAAE|nr:unnamed protein product [Brassicogethes aeneus]
MTDHLLKLVKYSSVGIGLWPLKLNGIKQKLYNFYFFMGFVYYIIFNLSQVIQGISVFGKDFEKTAANFSVTLPSSVVVSKVLVVISPKIKGLLEEMERKENTYLAAEDEALKQIYRKYASHARKAFILLFGCSLVGLSLYFTTPFFLEDVNLKPNETVDGHYFIVSSWFPFDQNQYYTLAYLIQFFGIAIGFTYICNTIALYFCMFIFSTAELKILQHVLKNFSSYARRYERIFNLSYEDAQRSLVRNIIIEHTRIIKFVEVVNKLIQLTMLADFLLYSLQMAFLVVQMLNNEIPFLLRCESFTYFVVSSVQLFLTYWHAHLVFIESQNIAQAAFESEWTTYELDVKKSLIVLIRRAQIPLCFSIGPIYKMKIDALIVVTNCGAIRQKQINPFVYYIIFNLSEVIQGISVFGKDFEKTAANLSVTLPATVVVSKVLVVISPKIKDLLEEMERKKNTYLAAEDEAVKLIYRKYASHAHKAVILLFGCSLVGLSLYYTTPFFLEDLNLKPNETVDGHYFIVSSWFPFDQNRYYTVAYLIQFFGIAIGFSYVCNTVALYFCMFIFSTAELKILQHVLKNFSSYARRYERIFNLSYENAQRALVRNIITEHTRSIKFVEEVNKLIQLIMLADFLLYSLQMAFLVVQMLNNEIPFLLRCESFTYFVISTVQLFLTYWHAHLVFIESQNIAQAAFESEWTTYELDVKKSLIVLIRRAQIPLCFSIGPIYKMKIDALIVVTNCGAIRQKQINPF